MVNIVNEVRQSEFIFMTLPELPLVSPIFTTEDAIIQDAEGRTIRVPLEEDPYGYRQYRKILYGVLTHWILGVSLDAFIVFFSS